ncbi:unnamed protein product [Symbiodinium necroappetens]|uniref:Uncharacterized protein n=1 Tax=Symbiodinium necroappetens TaxID=1628268 RepID=A0A812PHR4_9DINO|nr:unnamed protein product [Symbiodinium necroappetens]
MARLPETELELAQLGVCGDEEGCRCNNCSRSLPVSKEKVLYELVRLSNGGCAEYRNRLEMYKAKPPSPKELRADLAKKMQPNVAPHVLWDHAASVNLLLQNLLLEAGTSPHRQSLFLSLDLLQVLPLEKAVGLYPKPQEKRPPAPSSNAYTRLLTLDIVMATQAEFFEPREEVVLGAPSLQVGKAQPAKPLPDPKKKAPDELLV